MLVEFITRKHLHPDDLKMLPEGSGWLVVEFGADTEDEAAERAQERSRRLQGPSGSDAKLLDDDGAAEEDLGGARGGARRHRPCAGLAGSLSRLGGQRGAAAKISATICASSRRCSTTTATTPRSTAISATGWCIAASISISRTEKGLRNWRALPRPGRRPGRALWRHALRRARRRPGARRAAGKDVRAGAGAGLPRVQGDLGPGQQDEPGQGRRSLSDHLEPAARARLPADRIRRPLRLCRRRRQLHARRRAAASASANAAGATATTASCARATWRPARRSIPRAAAPACCSR